MFLVSSVITMELVVNSCGKIVKALRGSQDEAVRKRAVELTAQWKALVAGKLATKKVVKKKDKDTEDGLKKSTAFKLAGRPASPLDDDVLSDGELLDPSPKHTHTHAAAIEAGMQAAEIGRHGHWAVEEDDDDDDRPLLGVAGSHHSGKRTRLGEGRQSDLEDEVVAKLILWCGEPTTWNTQKKVIQTFKRSPMWTSWVKEGHNEQKLVNLINRLKIKHLEDGHNKDNGGGVSEFERSWPENALGLCRGVNDSLVAFQRANKGRSVSTAEWKAAPAQLWVKHAVLHPSHTVKYKPSHSVSAPEAATGNATAAAAVAAAIGTAPPGGVISGERQKLRRVRGAQASDDKLARKKAKGRASLREGNSGFLDALQRLRTQNAGKVPAGGGHQVRANDHAEPLLVSRAAATEPAARVPPHGHACGQERSFEPPCMPQEGYNGANAAGAGVGDSDSLDVQQRNVLQACLAGSNVFFSGMGGTGKTYNME
jgi:hypothetical protein